MSQVFKSLKSIAKLLILSKKSGVKPVVASGQRLVVMGNGPSLKDVFADRSKLAGVDTMAVNFAANTPEFFEVKPRYYTIADPHFYDAADDDNVKALFRSLDNVDWSMTLFVPSEAAKNLKRLIANQSIAIKTYNAVGVEGWQWLKNWAYDNRRGMPRPRNVLIPSVMIGVWLGYDEIYLAGADHSWTKSLWVNDDNKVVTNLPHYYVDNEHEQSRIKAVYSDVPLHRLFYSYYVAFKAYHEIELWARRRHVNIYNATKGSYIDAFKRKTL